MCNNNNTTVHSIKNISILVEIVNSRTIIKN